MFPDALQTARLNFRPMVPGDARAIFELYGQDPEVSHFLVWQPHRDISDTEKYLADCAAATSRRAYALVGRQDGMLRGAFDLRRPAPHSFSFGYLLARPYWGQGFMTEALMEVTDWALIQDQIWRVGAVCDVDNLASARVMEKAGLTREGLLRRWNIFPNISDIPRDCYSFAKTR